MHGADGGLEAKVALILELVAARLQALKLSVDLTARDGEYVVLSAERGECCLWLCFGFHVSSFVWRFQGGAIVPQNAWRCDYSGTVPRGLGRNYNTRAAHTCQRQPICRCQAALVCGAYADSFSSGMYLSVR